MREYDKNGLFFCEYQGRIFEESLKREKCSSLVFIRRFQHSDFAKILDTGRITSVSLITDDAFEALNNQYGETSYGKNLFTPDEMFWIGYFTRYVAYTREISTKTVFQLFPAEQLRKMYYVGHTQSEEYVIEDLLEMNHIDKNYFDLNWRVKNSIRKRLNSK